MRRKISQSLGEALHSFKGRKAAEI
jgi:hypothetical protein